MTSRPPPTPREARSPRELPEPTPRPGRDQALLDASRRVVALFLQAQTSDFPVRELAQHAGLSERTFYRYFPRKEDAIRPYVDAWIEEITERIRTAPRNRSLQTVVIEAHAAGFDVASEHDWRSLLRVVGASESLRAAWLQSVTNAESRFAQVLAERLGLPPGTRQAELCGAVLITAGRLALASQDRLPGEVFAECIQLLGPTLFRPPSKVPPGVRDKGPIPAEKPKPPGKSPVSPGRTRSATPRPAGARRPRRPTS